MADGDNKRVAITAGGLILSAPASYVVQRALGAWGVLDDISDGLGKWLKIHVPANVAGWTLALVFVLAIYAFILWRVWKPRHIYRDRHHVDVPERVGLGDSAEAEVVPSKRGSPLVRAKAISDSTTTNNFTNADTLVDAGQVDRSDVSGNTQTPVVRLTDVEREKIAETIFEVVDFVGTGLLPFYNKLHIANADGPDVIIGQAEEFEEARERLATAANGMWHKRRVYLDRIKFDIVPMMHALDRLQLPLLEAAKARDWPEEAKADRAKQLYQPMIDVGQACGNMNRIADEKRQEYLG